MIIPRVIEESSGEERQMDIFSRLMRERIILIGEEIDFHLANTVCAQLLLLDSEEPDKDISLYINSPGGSVIDGLAIYDTMRYCRSPIATFCLGQAASMASVLLLAGTHGKRHALSTARVMIHQGSGGMQGQATDLQIYAKEMQRLEKMINEMMAFHTGHPVEKIAADQERDFYMTAEQARDYGIVDTVVGP
jgi:ATP-dependent Clp protease protease subunit